MSGFCLLTYSSCRALWSWGWARRTLSPSLSPCTRTASSFDSLHTSLLSYPPEHDIYGNLFHCFVLAAAPSRPISFKLSSASAAMNIRTHPSVRGREFYPSPSFPPSRGSQPKCSPDIIDQPQNLCQHLSFLECWVPQIRQREKNQHTNCVTEIEEPQRIALEAHKSPLQRYSVIEIKHCRLSRDNSLEISWTMRQNLWFWNRDNLFESSTSLRYQKGFSVY